MSERNPNQEIVFSGVSKFYGEVLGVNGVELSLKPGITSLVGPNGSGKSTLMNLMTGLLNPSEGTITVLGESSRNPERLHRKMGYCTQFDTFPVGMTGWNFVHKYLALHGQDTKTTKHWAEESIERVGMTHAMHRKIAGYSKGMRQRIKLAQAIGHSPNVLVLDEPLNGLDPLSRKEIIALFKDWAREGLHLILSSHILHEVDLLSDNVVLLKQGYVVAEGKIRDVRSELKTVPLQILIVTDQPEDAARLASALIQLPHVTNLKYTDDRGGIILSTSNGDQFYDDLTTTLLEHSINIECITPMDEDVEALYDYLIGEEGHS